MITQHRLKELLRYDPETGVFRWLSSPQPSVRKHDVAGTINSKGYRTLSIKRQRYRAHRLAFLYMTGHFPTKGVDHINGITDDNRWVNLRDVDQPENLKNLKISKRNTSGVVGVSWDTSRRRWYAQINCDRCHINLGRFVDKFEAICARKSAENRLGFHLSHGKKKGA